MNALPPWQHADAADILTQQHISEFSFSSCSEDQHFLMRLLLYFCILYISIQKKKKITLLCLPSKIFAYHIMISFFLSLYSFAYNLQHYLPWLLCSLFPWKHIPSTSLVLKLLSKELYYEPQYGKFPFLQVCRSKKSVYILCFLESFLYLRTWTVVEK